MPHTASLGTSISFAFERLKRARQDGEPTQIRYWRERTDELLDEWLARREVSKAELAAATSTNAPELPA